MRAEEAGEGSFQLPGGHGPEVGRAEAEEAEAGGHDVGPGKGRVAWSLRV